MESSKSPKFRNLLIGLGILYVLIYLVFVTINALANWSMLPAAGSVVGAEGPAVTFAYVMSFIVSFLVSAVICAVPMFCMPLLLIGTLWGVNRWVKIGTNKGNSKPIE